MTYDEILSRFTVKKQYRDKAQCLCPAHDDREASLTVSKQSLDAFYNAQQAKENRRRRMEAQAAFQKRKEAE